MNKTITFDKKAKEEILNIFNKSVDEDGNIVEKENKTQNVLTPEGEELTLEDFAGIRKGSEIFIKSDLPSLINLADALQ